MGNSNVYGENTKDDKPAKKTLQDICPYKEGFILKSFLKL